MCATKIQQHAMQGKINKANSFSPNGNGITTNPITMTTAGELFPQQTLVKDFCASVH